MGGIRMTDKFTIADMIKLIGMVIAGLVFYFVTIQELQTRVVRLETNQDSLMEYVKDMRNDIKELIKRK